MLGVALIGVTVAGCAHRAPLSADDRLALYRRHAGGPVSSFELTRFVRQSDWTPLGEQTLAVWSNPVRGHLLELRSRCAGLGAAHTVSITNAFGTVRARFDSVVPRSADGSAGGACRILRIRPLDGRSLRDEQREMRRADYVERAADVRPDPAEATEDTP